MEFIARPAQADPLNSGDMICALVTTSRLGGRSSNGKPSEPHKPHPRTQNGKPQSHPLAIGDMTHWTLSTT